MAENALFWHGICSLLIVRVVLIDAEKISDYKNRTLKKRGLKIFPTKGEKA